MDERYTAIILRMSVSETVVSSNPGVSTSVTCLPKSSKVFPVSTLDVQDLSPSPTARPDPLSRLINYS